MQTKSGPISENFQIDLLAIRQRPFGPPPNPKTGSKIVGGFRENILNCFFMNRHLNVTLATSGWHALRSEWRFITNLRSEWHIIIIKVVF